MFRLLSRLHRCVAIRLSCLLAAVAPPLMGAPFDVKSFGAIGDGKMLDTVAINKAIGAAAEAGGGTVEFPAGNYLTFSIHLKSHVALHLDSGATIIAAEPLADLSSGYDAPEPNPFDQYQDFVHSHWHNSLIWGENVEDVTIAGAGRIFGRGLSRGFGLTRDLDREPQLRDELPEERRADVAAPRANTSFDRFSIKPGPFGYPGSDTLPAGIGNKTIALKNCRNVTLRDFTIYHGGSVGILATGVANVTFDNLKIDTNRDGIDLDNCQNIRVSNCIVNSPYDDGICLKSSYALGVARPTENVTIVNCQMSGYDEGTLLDGSRQCTVTYPIGRIKCGTESNGGFRSITISNCVFAHCCGLAFESVDGASMEDIIVSNIAMRDIANAPIFIRLGARLRGPEGAKVGSVRRIKIYNVVAHNVAAQSGVLLAGLKTAPIEDIALSNIFVDYVRGGKKDDGDRVVPEFEKDYPEPVRFGTLPSWGLWARHVKNLIVHEVELRAARDDFRPTVILDDVADAHFDHAMLPHAIGAPALSLKNVAGLIIYNTPGIPDTKRLERIIDENL